jgi:alpha-1,2-glucosyltransferase
MGIFSLLSVYVRQNNIIWCAFLLVYRIIGKYSVSIGTIRGNVFRSVIGFIKLMFINGKDIIKTNYVQILVFPVFCWYLYKFNNGKLVFGDHLNHQTSFHPTQFLYLLIFIVVNLPITFNDFGYTIKETFARLYFSRHALAAYLFLVSVSIILVDKWTIVHPFILADNRHYIFYIYRYFKWSKYILCLIYPFCLICIIRLIVNSNEKLVKLILWGFSSMLYLMLTPLV